MYESPIEIIQTQMNVTIENEVLKATQGIGVNVDKAELMKALQYDREQYNKGYKDGIKEFAERLKEKGRYPLTNIYYEVIGLKQRKIWLEEDIDNLVKEMVGDTE